MTGDLSTFGLSRRESVLSPKKGENPRQKLEKIEEKRLETQ